MTTRQADTAREGRPKNRAAASAGTDQPGTRAGHLTFASNSGDVALEALQRFSALVMEIAGLSGLGPGRRAREALSGQLCFGFYVQGPLSGLVAFVF
ncbi:hypothetical protein [Streptomyces sp. NBC_01217]|uniref:hypothetical protein n=1 Tax=Streptomyces sp. NBC_01217 TaxID=2903779 RepID=UPI002E14E94C|nr:hypothetical protein OG507_01825 [Streptomyces sp. NBC_01217]